MSNLVDHAVRELDLIGCDDSEFSGRKEVLEIIEVFSKQGHSGGSAGWVIAVVMKLMNFENLSPLTDNPEDWIEVGENTWQNRRNSKAFSEDGGKTFTILDEGTGGSKIVHRSEES